MAGAMRLFGNVYSPPTRACLWLLRSFDIPHKFEPVDVWKGEAKTAVFKKMNPSCTVPVLKDGDFVLFQGASIMRYLCEKHDLPSHIYPKECLEKRAQIDQWLFWQHLNIRSAAGALMQGTRSKNLERSPSKYSNSTNISYDDRRMESRGGVLVETDGGTFTRALDVLDTVLSKQDFIGGEEFCLADLRMTFEIAQIEAEKHLKYVRYGNLRYDMSKEVSLPPNVAMWHARMALLPGMAETCDEMMEIHSKLFKAQHDFFVSRLSNENAHHLQTA